MQKIIHSSPQDVQGREESEIPVDNSEFSTFSTGFSTGVFHRVAEETVFIIDLHKKIRRIATVFPLFRPPWFLPQRKTCAQFQGLTKVFHREPVR